MNLDLHVQHLNIVYDHAFIAKITPVHTQLEYLVSSH